MNRLLPLEEHIQKLRQELDELHESKFLLEQDLKKESHLRAEMQEFIGNIHDSCQSLLDDEENKLEATELAQNLLKNIRDFAKEYKLRI
ncbi:MAG: hypothetical protein AAF149_05795 [Bacteroidota bacterium]